MGKISIGIVEDEFVVAEDIRDNLERHGFGVCGVYDRAEIAAPKILQLIPDLLLVDIRLAGPMNGIELVRNIQTEVQLPVIYITANSNKATYENARATRPNAFLIKPFTPENLIATIDLALYNYSENVVPEKISRTIDATPASELIINKALFIRDNGVFRKVPGDEILFAEASGSYVHLQTKNQRFTLSQNLTQFQKKTPLPHLVRIHRSYLVNINKVESFQESAVFVQNHKLPLSETHRAEFMARIHLL